METWSDAGDDIIHPNLHPKKNIKPDVNSKDRNYFGII
jgi:hypothetical protein